jgi:hypothetical protein
MAEHCHNTDSASFAKFMKLRKVMQLKAELAVCEIEDRIVADSRRAYYWQKSSNFLQDALETDIRTGDDLLAAVNLLAEWSRETFPEQQTRELILRLRHYAVRKMGSD